jgi:hypothetical protein
MTWYPRVRVRIRTLLLALAVMSLLSFPLGIAGVQAQDPLPRTFPETGRSLQGIFLEYWESHGGLAQQGYPISDEIFETSPLDGKRHKVQYFERAVFERHSENNPPYDVLLVQLGTFRYKELYGEQGAQGQRANPAGRLFPETGFHLGGIFLDYWEKHGGLPQLGYPISDEFDEKSDLDGKTYRVQYFERAVMEHHRENKAPYDVLLSQLGTFRYRHEYPTDTEPAATPAAASRHRTHRYNVSAGPTGDSHTGCRLLRRSVRGPQEQHRQHGTGSHRQCTLRRAGVCRGA